MCAQSSLRAADFFKWIAGEEKQFLSVNLSAIMARCISLNKFVQDQAQSWSKYWHPANGSSRAVADAFCALWHKAIDLRSQENKPLADYFGDKNIFDGIIGYKKNSFGSDLWSAKGDLANLPFIALGEFFE